MKFYPNKWVNLSIWAVFTLNHEKLRTKLAYKFNNIFNFG